MIIRQETEQDYSRIRELVRVAFQTAQVSNGKEQDLVDELRAGPNYLPELALVAEEDGDIIGHSMIIRFYVDGDQRRFEVLYVAPISVVLEQRNRGIGSALIGESFRLAREMGFSAVILVGDPDYYHRFGFQPSVSFGIKNTEGIPDENVMVCELLPDALQGVSGTVTF